MFVRNRWFRPAVTLFIMSTLLFTAGRALAAWQFDKAYGSGLYPATSWAPYQGRLQGSGGTDAQGQRATQPLASSIQWNQTAISWMQGSGASTTITFHSASSSGNTGPSGTGSCSNWWKAVSWASTNLPSGTATVFNRNCGFTFANEVRIGGNMANFFANTAYFAQSWYQDTDTSSDPAGQFNVDTYSGGSPDFHQKYCISASANTAHVC